MKPSSINAAPLVSVVIPALNEAPDIEACIAGIGAQDYPSDRLEVIVVDGCSADDTAARAKDALAAQRFATGRLVVNPDPRTSRSLNVGLAEASGEYVVRIDARSRVEPHYVQRCVDLLAARPELGVVGGAQHARPRSTQAVDVGIARALRNRWTTGLSRYRRVNESGPADTVWMGAFRRRELVDLGGWDPAVALNEDFELCQRYRAGGAKVWFEVALQSGYVPRADFASLAKQYFRFGRVKGTWWARGRRPQPRQVLLLAAPVFAGGVLALIGRRIGFGRATVLAGAALITVEVAGTRDPRGGPSAHAAAAVAIVTSNAAWWVGTVVGFTGETIGVTHRHG